MRYLRFTLILLLSVMILAACMPGIETPAERPDFEVITLQITPALAHWLPEVAACAGALDYFGVQTQVLPRIHLNLTDADLLLRLGPRMDTDPHVAVMGYEEIVVFTGEDVPLDSLSLESLRAIYTGKITRWEEVPEVIEQNLEINQRITTFAYPEEHEIRTLFESTFLDQQPIESNPQLYTTMPFLGSLLEEDPYAVGFGLLSQMPGGSQRLMITDENGFSGQQFVLAVTPEEPGGNLLQLLLCLQTAQ